MQGAQKPSLRPDNKEEAVKKTCPLTNELLKARSGQASQRKPQGTHSWRAHIQVSHLHELNQTLTVKTREKSPVHLGGVREKESVLDTAGHSVLLKEACSPVKLFCQSLTYWDFIRAEPTWGKGNTCFRPPGMSYTACRYNIVYHLAPPERNDTETHM